MPANKMEPSQSSKQAMKLIGSRKDVYNGKAEKTTGGLKHSDLMLNNQGKVVSKRRHDFAMSVWGRNPDLRAKFAEGQAPLLNASKAKEPQHSAARPEFRFLESQPINGDIVPSCTH